VLWHLSGQQKLPRSGGFKRSGREAKFAPEAGSKIRVVIKADVLSYRGNRFIRIQQQIPSFIGVVLIIEQVTARDPQKKASPQRNAFFF
jgi:hypothetical protein